MPPPNPYAAAPAPGMPPGWTPPPKPGLIPLRPLTLGTLLGASFQVMRRNPRPTFGFALLLAAIVSVISVFAIAGVGFLLFSRPLSAGNDEDAMTLAAGGVFGGFLVAFLVPLALSLVAYSILQGIIALEVARGTLGEKLKLAGLWRWAKGRIGALIGWSVLLAAAAVVYFLIVAFIVGALTAGFFASTALGGEPNAGGFVLIVLMTLVFYAGFFVLAAWFGVRTVLVPSILVIERLTLGRAIARSWRLTHRSFWKTFGILLLVGLIIGTASNIITLPVQFIGGLAGGLLNPTGGTTESMMATLIGVSILLTVVSVIVGAIGLIVQSAATSLIYIDLRMRKEGLDLELARFVEARQAGDTSVPDPYLPPHHAGGPSVPSAPPTTGASPWA